MRASRLAGLAGVAYVVLVVTPTVLLLVTANALFGAGALSLPPGAPGGGAGDRALGRLSGDQEAYARLITSVVAERGLPRRAAVVAIAAASQESRLGQAGMNRAVDHDSLGLFQQRPSMGWGTAAQVKNPVYATNAFLDGLVEVDGWEGMSVTRAAQRVQRSAFPNAYARWEPAARAYSARFWPGGAPARAPVAPRPVPPPPGPAAPTDAVRAGVVRTALAQLGRPSGVSAASPAVLDGPGLAVIAWQAAGVTLPPTTSGQARFGAPIASVEALRPGDLVVVTGAGGTPADPGAVVVYVGDGRVVEAPGDGRPVTLSPLDRLRGTVVALRRPDTVAPDAP